MLVQPQICAFEILQKMQNLTNKYSFGINKHRFLTIHTLSKLPAKINFEELGFSIMHPEKSTLKNKL